MNRDAYDAKERGKLVSICVFAGALGAALILLLRPFVISGGAHSEIIALWKQVELGQTKEQVRRAFTSTHFHYLRLNEFSTNEWVVQTPLQFGAGNWVLEINYGESIVSGIKVRTEDDSTTIPKGAPPDKISN